MGIFQGRPIDLKFSIVVTLLFVLALFQFSAHATAVSEVAPAENNGIEYPLQLTPEEQQWLAAHKTISIAYDGSLPPYSFINDTGKIDGIAVEIISILGQRLGVNFSVHPDSNWDSLYKAAAKRQVDVIATMVNRPERATWFSFTKPYLTKSLVIVTKLDNTTINSRDDLADKKIAVIKGYQYAGQLGIEFPNAKPVSVDNILDSLKHVASGEVDAAILFLGTANYLQTKHQLDNLKVAAFYDRNNANESIAVRKDWPILAGILQKGLDSLSEQEVQKIFAKWIVEIPQTETTHTEEKPPAPVEAAVKPEIKPVVKEIEQQPPAFNVPKPATTEPAKPPKKIPEVEIILFLGLLVATLSMFWLGYLRRQLKQQLASTNEIIKSVKNLQSLRTRVKNLTTAQPIEINLDELTPKAKDKPTPHPDNDYIYYQHDCDGHFSYVSASVTRLLGYSETDFMANYRKYLTKNAVNDHIDVYTLHCIQGYPNAPYEIEIYDAERNKRWLQVMDTPVYDGQGHCVGVDGVMHDITAQKLAEELPVDLGRESESTMMDEVPTLLDQVRHAIQTTSQFALIYVSMGHLRPLDNSLASFAETDVLDEADKRICAAIRISDTPIRIDSHSYALILPDTDLSAVGLIMDKIRKLLQIPYLIGIQSIVLDANLGFAVYPASSADAELLIKKAAILLPAAKSATLKESATAPITIDLADDEDLQLQQDLMQALDECNLTLRASNPENINALSRNCQFTVYYQSRHNATDFNIAGFEALVRWQHPKRGMILPRDFIPQVKGLGMLDMLSYWVIQQVSFQALLWENLGIRPDLFAITVNLEDLAVKRAVDVSRIIGLIREAGAKPEWLQFSIPEKEIAKNPERLIPIIQQFVAEGMVVAIDNFGSDSALLGRLKDIPAQVIEIDPEFIRGLPYDEEGVELISLTIDMLRNLGKIVIAKEVETEAQLDCLKQSGCDLIQGHLLSRPLPAQEAKELIISLPDLIWYLRQK